MRNRLLAVAVMVLALGACGDDDDDLERYTTILNGANERPTPNNSTATGTGSLTVNSNRTITYSLTQTGMTPTVQHIHGPANADGSAGVIVGVSLGTNLTLTPSDFPAGATIGYDSLLVLLRNNLTYFNIHSTTFPGGEIRGNLRRP
jgi:hypothetical protein